MKGRGRTSLPIIFLILINIILVLSVVGILRYQKKPQKKEEPKPIESFNDERREEFIREIPPPPFPKPTYASFPKPEDVLVIYNLEYLEDEDQDGVPDGVEIARYYQEARHIPEENLCPINCSIEEEIERSEYEARIKPAIESYLEKKGLKEKIRYLVLTKGIPLKIKGRGGWSRATYSSVDAALCLLFQDYEIKWRLFNPYYNIDPRCTLNYYFLSSHFRNSQAILSYLVTRLDGYTVSDIKGMIDRSLLAGREEGCYILDDHPGIGYDQMLEAYDNLKSLGCEVVPDPWEENKGWIIKCPEKVLGYCSHGKHSGMPPDYILSTLHFDYAPGALFNTYESFNGWSFISERRKGQGMIADFIKKGGTGGVGAVYEPFASSVAHEEVLFPAYASGYPLADAAYMSLRYLDFTQIVVGDPLTAIGSLE